MKSKILLTSFILLLFGVLSCKKGDIGPAGPQGATGVQGPQGPVGNANVKVDTFTLSNTQWLYGAQLHFNSAGSILVNNTRYHDRANTAITQDILDKGFILVYFMPSAFDNPNNWMLCPYEYKHWVNDAYSYNVAGAPWLGKMRLHFWFKQYDPNATLPNLQTFNIQSFKFKVVVVAGTLGGRGLGPGIDFSDHDATMRYLGL